MANTVTQEQIEMLNAIIGPKATSLRTAVIRLHTASGSDKKWVYTGLCGALCFIIDRQMGGVAVFRMYDLNAFSLLFEAELYYEFEQFYKEMNDNFYCFPIPGQNFIGFSFADSEEAMFFKISVRKYSPKQNFQEKIRDKIKKMIVDAPKKRGFFTKIFGGNKKQDLDEMEDIDNFKISRPENPVHENHIGWDPKNQTFDLSQLSKELKRVFKKAGITKKDLKDTNTALLIADAILNQPVLEISNQKEKDRPGSKRDSFESPEPRKSSMFGTSLKSLAAQGNGGEAMKRASLMQTSEGMKRTSLMQRASLMQAANNLSKQEEISLTTKLASAIAQRRKQLTKNDMESEEDDWSEDDY